MMGRQVSAQTSALTTTAPTSATRTETRFTLFAVESLRALPPMTSNPVVLRTGNERLAGLAVSLARRRTQLWAVPIRLNMRFLLALRAIFFVLLLPGIVAGYVPFRILSAADQVRVPELGLSSAGASIV